MRGALATAFTPFGYLRNPGHRASSWAEVKGGNLRTPTEWLGMEWVYPLQRNPRGSAGIRIETSSLRTRADFAAVGLTSRHHTSEMLGFDWPGTAARFFLVDDDALAVRLDRQIDISVVQHAQGELPLRHALLTRHTATTIWAVLARAATEHQAHEHARAALDRAEQRYEEILDADTAFDDRCPRLSGDWPGGWREGLHYDFQTTRMLVQPAGGIFDDVWPAWMVSWPRVVLAEGVLDMLRLGYADPGLAQWAILSMFRSAPMPNVPCVFQDGDYNMVAADGSRCGTSPAWCLPFLNLELLYLRTLDRDWLSELYPYLVAYLEFWLRERIDSEGWVVYKCTWESGEDGNPRLDPTGSGDGVISDRVRPVELQATMAHAAQVMRFFAAELGNSADQDRWHALEHTYRLRTQELYDTRESRYRDWLTRERSFQVPRPEQPYWGTDACRWSPLGLTPLLIGEPLDSAELWRHATPPWTWWPSWTYALVESAAAAGHYQRIGQLASEIVDRVYRVTTRSELGSLERPLPGGSPEFWPEDWRTYDGHDGYGWGATTANLLIRHVFGFKESRVTDRFVFELTPALGAVLHERGQRLALQRLNYRGLAFDVEYAAMGEDVLHTVLQLREAGRGCRVYASDGARVYSTSTGARHEFSVRDGHRFRVELD